MGRRSYDVHERAMCELIGAHFLELRLASGLSQNEAARRASIVRQTLAPIERGETFPVICTAFRLARVYGSTLTDLAKVVDEHFMYEEPGETAA